MDADLSRAVWHKSTFSNGSGGDCVEAACNLSGIVAVRDSKNPDMPALVVSDQAWSMLLQGIKHNEFDL